MSDKGFHLEPGGLVGVVRLARPPVNAVTFELLERLAEVVAEPSQWSPQARCVVLAAEGSHFSAGMDRSELATLDRDRLTGAATALGALVERPLPLVAAVQGSAVGTGFILAACADLMVVDDNADVWLPETEIGMLGGAGHARRWLPMPIVRRMVLTGEKVSAAVLHRHGATKPYPGLTPERTAMEIGLRLADKDPAVLGLANQVLADLDADAAAIHRHEMATTPLPPFTDKEVP